MEAHKESFAREFQWVETHYRKRLNPVCLCISDSFLHTDTHCNTRPHAATHHDTHWSCLSQSGCPFLYLCVELFASLATRRDPFLCVTWLIHLHVRDMAPSCLLHACLSSITPRYFQHVRPDFDPPGSIISKQITWEHMTPSICMYPPISTDIPTAKPFQYLLIPNYPQLSTGIPDILDHNFEVPSHKRIQKPTSRALQGDFNGHVV